MNVQTLFFVDVEQRHIIGAMRDNCAYCPVANAIREHGFDCAVYTYHTSIFNSSGPGSAVFDNHPITQEFIKNYDRNGTAVPTTVFLELVDSTFRE